MARKKIVIIGLIGTVVDTGAGPTRWERWRPTVDLCRHEDLVVDRLELLTQARFQKLTDQVTEDIKTCSPETQVRHHCLEMVNPWDFEEVYGVLFDFARGYKFDPEKEEYLIHITTGTHVAQICMFLLTEAHWFPAKLIQTAPPGGHKKGDAGTYAIIDLDLSKYDRLASRFSQQTDESLSFLKSGIETRNIKFNALIEQIERVAIASKAPMLLMGPTGAGKSQLARKIYELKKSRRQISGDFVEVNCATIRGDGAMSALFGHTRGAFTGAVAARPGLLRAADGGILFLDEIGELSLDEQAMMLRAIEEKRFLPVGSDKEVKSDFQLLAGTNSDLNAAIAAGDFREDLFARINLWTYRLPGLADRREDIEPNIAYELAQFAETNGTNVTFSKEAYDDYVAFAKSGAATWARNFRDLNASISRMATLSAGGRITLELVQAEIQALKQSWRGADGLSEASVLAGIMSAKTMDQLDRFDRVQLEDVVRVCRQSASLSDAGRTLFASSRKKKKDPNDADRLRKYLARFDLEWADIRA